MMRIGGPATLGVGTALLLAAAGLGACHPASMGQGRNGRDRAVTVADRLDCPSEQGDLKRTDQSADGRGCSYSGDDGEVVKLGYLALDGKSAEDGLKPVEVALKADLPAPGAGGTWSAGKDGEGEGEADKDDDGGASATPGPPTPPAPPAPPKRDHVAINLPGLHIDASDNGASIHAFGQNIVADDKGAKVNGDVAGMKTQIDASDDGAEIRFGFFGEKAVDMTYILASDAAGPSGEHAAAYVAKGPAAGPLVLATATSRAERKHFGKDDFDDVRALVDRNVRRARR